MLSVPTYDETIHRDSNTGYRSGSNGTGPFNTMTDIAEQEEGSKTDLEQTEENQEESANHRREGVLVMRPRNVLKETNNDSGFDEKD